MHVLHTHTSHPLALLACRYSSTATSPCHTFIVWAPGSTNPGALTYHLTVRPQHLVCTRKLQARGMLLTGGSMRAPEAIVPGASADTQNAFVGSTMVFAGSSLEEVHTIIESDLYYTSGVWDKEKLMILPYFPALPWPEN
ncbi:hypothetical protein K488DRAFT_58054 [Vararia minispora EC-137]|uniref:Uncharacterized protein n=1 Tax=Vararia minispora EC-137 TaxID=1314806 RepID=A0ACB8QAR1_9AGAM|nr:hypothetical protein K488DRAFT_58054 [Vararia minispora EC-137]